MASGPAVIYENWVLLDIPLLQPGSHLSDMRRIAAIVLVASNKQHGGIIDITLNAVIRGIRVKCSEVFCITDRTIFVFP